MQYALGLMTTLFTLVVTSQHQIDLDYYLPKNITYDSSIPKPADIIGHEIGAWHVTHDKLIFYLQALAEKSDRISMEHRGKTFEDRPLPLLTITSSRNHQDIERLRSEHMALTEQGSERMNTDTMPVVVYQGFSIHGNESSGSNAALAYAYHLAAAQGPEIDALLENMVILLDPCITRKHGHFTGPLQPIRIHARVQ